LQFATIAAPIVGPMLPDDAAELDGHLLNLANWLLAQRSDDAEPAACIAIAAPGIDGWQVDKAAPTFVQEPLPEGGSAGDQGAGQ
jgi:hypothetical protein